MSAKAIPMPMDQLPRCAEDPRNWTAWFRRVRADARQRERAESERRWQQRLQEIKERKRKAEQGE